MDYTSWENVGQFLAEKLSIKLTKVMLKTDDSKSRYRVVKSYISGLEEYEKLLLAHQICSYYRDSKMWYGFIYRLVLNSLNEQWKNSSPNAIKNSTARGGIDFKKAKQEIKCEAEATKNGVALKSIGGDKLIGICPFHQDTHPSFYIYLDTNSFHCFGCKVGGDSIELMELFNKEKIGANYGKQ
jgi:hypothetical protein|tara:strand:- start:1090 stop:1641 length:552 start_codon:yes stop_codon:yes gene_type:complete